MPLDPTLVQKTMAAMPTDEGLNNLRHLGAKLVLELNIQAELEKAIEESKLSSKKLSEEEIPALLGKLGLQEIKLSSGERIKLTSVYGGTITEERATEALGWLRNNGQSALIKNIITTSFGMGEDKLAAKVKVTLTEKGIPFESKEGVHWQTLKSFVKGQYEAGMPFPEALFGAFTKTIAEVKTK